MAGILQSAWRVLAFVVLWAVVAVVPLEVWEEPGVLGGHPAWLRLYWEVVPLVVLIALTAVFARCVNVRLVRVPFTSRPLRDTVVGVSVGAAWIGSVLLLAQGWGILSVVGATDVDLVVVLAVALLLNAATQELLVHGYVFSYLHHRYSATVAVVLTALLFLTFHAGAFTAGAVAVANVVAAGLLFGLVRVLSGGVWVPIVVHFVWNLVGGLVFGLVTLGDPVHVLDASLHGPAWLTGGPALLEGSALTLVVTCVLAAGVGWRLRRRPGWMTPSEADATMGHGPDPFVTGPVCR